MASVSAVSWRSGELFSASMDDRSFRGMLSGSWTKERFRISVRNTRQIPNQVTYLMLVSIPHDTHMAPKNAPHLVEGTIGGPLATRGSTPPSGPHDVAGSPSG